MIDSATASSRFVAVRHPAVWLLAAFTVFAFGCSSDETSKETTEQTVTDTGSNTSPDIAVCAPVCDGKTCGDDGCGGECGTCSAFEACTDTGACECVPSCEKTICGDDGCGGDCGTCETGAMCSEGKCVCAPECTDKECGDDSCGGTCGTCETGATCGDTGKCDCVPDCSGAPCATDGCGGVCDTCGSGQVCMEDTCCTPTCGDSVCGNDGCGALCGTCPDDKPYCVEGACEPPCQPDCEGKECGHNGCGSVCGSCDPTTPTCVQGSCKATCSDCQLSGTVYAPEGTIPISGALVYLTLNPPEPIPQGLFCDKCLQLPFGTPFGETDEHGKFSFGVQTEGDWTLVVQKGSFRRIRPLTVTGGPQALTKDLTTLPGKTDLANGDNIPKMAVVPDSYDNIENTLAKIGLGDVDFGGDLNVGTENFDLIDESDAANFFSDPTNLAQYQVIFMPCDNDWFHPKLNDPAVQKALRDWVIGGGKLYVTDWSYDILKHIFPDPISWKGDDGSLNSADLGTYDAPAVVKDPGLKAWLAAQGITDFDLEDNWSIIESLHAYTAPDPDGVEKLFLPKSWVSAETPDDGLKNSTVSFEYGCGRGMFSTYHTEAGNGSGLLAQELALAYVVFEVGICAQGKD
jgi:hypothetical protein